MEKGSIFCFHVKIIGYTVEKINMKRRMTLGNIVGDGSILGDQKTIIVY